MLEIMGGALMMAGGGMLTAASVTVGRSLARTPAAAIGIALDDAYPADVEPVPDDMAAMLGQMP